MPRFRRKMIFIRRVAIIGGLALLAILLAASAASLIDGSQLRSGRGLRLPSMGSDWGYFSFFLILAPVAVWAAIRNWR